MGLPIPVLLRSLTMPAMAARPRACSFHVLVQAQGLALQLPDGRRMSTFQTWRVVRADSVAQAEAIARSRVLEDWVGGWGGDLPELKVLASSRLGWMGRLAAHDTPFEFMP